MDNEIRMEYDALTRILKVNGVWIEDLPLCERSKIVGLLFRGGQERAALQEELERRENQSAELEHEKTVASVLKTALLMIVVINIFVWYMAWTLI